MRYTLSKEFIGYGHYRLTVKDESGKEKSAVTGNIDLISRLSSELEVEREKATEEAIIMCCRNHKIYCIFVRKNVGRIMNLTNCFTYVLH